MAVTLLTGFELGSVNEPVSITLGTNTAFSTAQARTGTRSIRCNPGSGATGYATIGQSPTGIYVHFGLYIATAPSVTRWLFGNGTGLTLKLNSDRTISAYDGSTLIGTSAAALSTGQWYWIGLRNATGTGVDIVQVDGSPVISGNLTTAATQCYLGCYDALSSAIDLYYDDVIYEASFLQPSKVALLVPISDNTVTGVTDANGATTNLWQAVDSTPPAGVASANEAANPKASIKYPANVTCSYIANLTTYTSAGVGASDTVIAFQAFIRHGEDIATGTKNGTFAATTNPARTINAAFPFGQDQGAHGAEPGFWVTLADTIQTNPSVTFGTSPTIQVDRASQSRVGCVDFIGAYVAWTPATLGGTISPGGIDGAEAFGSHTSKPGGVNVAVTGTASTEAFGAILAHGDNRFSLTGIATAEGFGAPTSRPGAVALAIAGLDSAEGFGSGAFSPGGVKVVALAIGSGEVFGPIILTNLSPALAILASAITSGEIVGPIVLVPGGVPVGVSGLASLEALGSLGLLGQNWILPTGVTAPTGGAGTAASETFTGSGVPLVGHTADVGGSWANWLNAGGGQNELYFSQQGTGKGLATVAQFVGSGTAMGGVVLPAAVGDGDQLITVIASGATAGVLARARSSGSKDAYAAVVYGSNGYVYRITNGVWTLLGGGSFSGLGLGMNIRIRMRVSGVSPTAIKLRGWQDGTGEPGTWAIDTSDNTAANQQATGYTGLAASLAFDDYFPSNESQEIDNFEAIATGGGSDLFGQPIFKPSNLLLPTGLDSLEALGAVVLQTSGGPILVLPSGIISAELLGSLGLLPGFATVLPGGVASTEAVGALSLLTGGFFLLPNGILSSELFGSGILLPGGVTFIPNGLVSSEAIGFDTLQPGQAIILPGGLGTAVVVGSHQLTGLARILAAGVGSAEIVGSDTLVPGLVSIVPGGLISAELLGSLIISTAAGAKYIVLEGLLSAELFGSHLLRPGPVGMSVSGIASGQVLGSNPILQALATVLPTGLSTGEALGASTLRPGPVPIIMVGVGSNEIFGVPVLPAGGWFLLPTGIVSAAALGASLFLGRNYIQPVSLDPPNLYGVPGLVPGSVQILVQSIDSGEFLGPFTVELEELIKALRWARMRPFGAVSERRIVTQSKFGETNRGE